MKKIFLFPLLLLTACETVCRPDNSFVRSDLSIKAQSMVQGPAAKNFTPIVKAEVTAPEVNKAGQKIVIPKAEIYQVAEIPKTEKLNVTALMPIERLESERLNLPKIDKMPTASIPSPSAISPSTPMSLLPASKSSLSFRFPESKDELTPYEQARLKLAIKPESKKLTISIAPDQTRTGFEMIAAVKKRSDLIRSHFPKTVEVSVNFAPHQEANTVRINQE